MQIFKSKEQIKQSKREKFISEILDIHNSDHFKFGVDKIKSNDAALIFKCLKSVYAEN